MIRKIDILIEISARVKIPVHLNVKTSHILQIDTYVTIHIHQKEVRILRDEIEYPACKLPTSMTNMTVDYPKEMWISGTNINHLVPYNEPFDIY